MVGWLDGHISEFSPKRVVQEHVPKVKRPEGGRCTNGRIGPTYDRPIIT